MPCIAIFGTGSDVGKSIVTTALCRYLKNKGLSVAPYKAQNMSNNSGVTPDGMEMGRAQIVQAEAAKIPPHADMNPILLKPTSDVGSQVVVLGQAIANKTASQYHKEKETLFSTACAALDRLRDQYEYIVMEGAGSCAEVNLMAHDIVNFRIAEYADAPVILVADIHRGGVFAQIVGTMECLEPKYRNRIKGFIINRFRGDIALFQDGVRWIEEKTGKPVFGVLPWYNHFRIEAEDSVVIEAPKTVAPEISDTPAIAVIRLPHISNFTDFDPLLALKGIKTYFIEQVQELDAFKAVILPGSKNTRFDLDWLKTTGWAAQLQRYADKGGHILGICGGYQFLGNSVHDPHGLEGNPGSTEGLKFLPVETILKSPKTTTLTRFVWDGISGTAYEIHVGRTDRVDGQAMSDVVEYRNVMGTYMHGLFDTPAITKHWLEKIGLPHIEVSKLHGPAARDREYDLLAEHFEKYVDAAAIFK